MDILKLLQSELQGDAIKQLSNQTGIQDPQKAQSAAIDIAQLLTGALARNAQSGQLNNIASALDRDHDGSVLDDLMGYLQGNMQTQNAKALNGMGILNHILGPRQQQAAQMIGQQNGLNSQNVMQMMTTLAPVIMGLLGKQKKSQGLDAAGIMSLLSMVGGNKQAGGGIANNLLNSLLDSNGDGNIQDDIARKGLGLLGNLFKKRR